MYTTSSVTVHHNILYSITSSDVHVHVVCFVYYMYVYLHVQMYFLPADPSTATSSTAPQSLPCTTSTSPVSASTTPPGECDLSKPLLVQLLYIHLWIDNASRVTRIHSRGLTGWACPQNPLKGTMYAYAKSNTHPIHTHTQTHTHTHLAPF